jgi:hypothetical protein
VIKVERIPWRILHQFQEISFLLAGEFGESRIINDQEVGLGKICPSAYSTAKRRKALKEKGEYYKAVRKLRQQTGHTISVRECQKALTEASGDLEQALGYFHEKGLTQKKGRKLFYTPFSCPDIPPLFGYILTKAKVFLKIGAELYRRGDALGMPPEEWTPDTLTTIRQGFEQLLDCKGYRPNEPLAGIGIAGLYDLMATLHFKMIRQKAHREEHNFLDEIIFQHIMSGNTITIYNKVLITDYA